MTKPDTVLQAGKQLAAVAAGRAFKDEPPGPGKEDPGSGAAALSEVGKATQDPAPAEKEGGQDPGNPNAVDHGEQDPGQEKG